MGGRIWCIGVHIACMTSGGRVSKRIMAKARYESTRKRYYLNRAALELEFMVKRPPGRSTSSSNHDQGTTTSRSEEPRLMLKK